MNMRRDEVPSLKDKLQAATAVVKVTYDEYIKGQTKINVFRYLVRKTLIRRPDWRVVVRIPTVDVGVKSDCTKL